MPSIRLFQAKTTVASGQAGDFPSASGHYDTSELDAITVICAPGAATARTIRLTFADSAGNTLFVVDKALAATTAAKFISIGQVSSADDLLVAGDGLDQFMVLPPKVRVSFLSAAVAIDVAIVGK